jgi:hypothetical protein
LLAAPSTASGSLSRAKTSSSLQAPLPITSGLLPGPPRPAALVRRESTRMVKVPSRIEDDDPETLASRIMDRCNQVLRLLRNKGLESGIYFAAPVDPVKLGIPTYFDIIKDPMDLHVYPPTYDGYWRDQNSRAMTFNVDPLHTLINQRGIVLSTSTRCLHPLKSRWHIFVGQYTRQG